MIKIVEILDFFDKCGIPYSYTGSKEISFETFCPLNFLKKNAITWVRHAERLDVDALNLTKGIILVAEKGATILNANFPIIFVENVHRSFFMIIQEFFYNLDIENHKPEIAKTAIVESDNIGKNIFIGHHTFIGRDVILGDNVSIMHNVTIQGKVLIGDYSTIESGTSIGVCGFGHYWDDERKPITVPHLGGVKIGSHVKIGANNTISRGCLADTIIEDYVKTDNLCYIAHNVLIKERAILTANSIVSGSSIIGKNVWLAPGSLIRDGITVGDNAFVGLGASVVKNIPADKTVFGVPARVIRDRRE